MALTIEQLMNNYINDYAYVLKVFNCTPFLVCSVCLSLALSLTFFLELKCTKSAYT